MNLLEKTVRYSWIFLPLLTFLQCTAYFNTFYNAETAYKEANVAHSKVMRNYPDSIVVTPTQEIAVKYERAIEKSIKVIETYNKKKKWHDDALFLMGKAYFFKKDMAKAIRRFNELQQDFPSSPFIPESYLYMAKAYIEDDNLNKAEEVIEMILQKYPALDKEQQVSMLMMEIAVRRHGNAQAILLLEKAFKSVKSEEKRIDLILRLAELYIEMKQYHKAIVLLEHTPRKKNFPEQSYRMDKALVNSYIEIDSLQKALSLVESMRMKKKYEDHKSEILFKKGIILAKLGRTDDAIFVFEEITSKLDSAKVQNDTCYICSQALYELALLYQNKKADMENAKKYYSLSSQSKDTSHKVISKQRLDAIDMLHRLREGKDSLDGPKSSRLYKIAELFKYELKEPDSAYAQYLTIINDSSSDSALISKALSAAAFVVREELNDSVKADSLYRIILANFPATDYAKDAQKQLRMKVTIKTRQDSAYDAFCRAEDLLYKKGDIKGSVQSFYNVFKTYSDLSIAPKSLYVAAWLTDDLLQKKRTAKMLYEKVCEKYPTSEYCKEQAHYKIQTVLDTLKVLEAGKKATETDKKRTKEKKDNTVIDSSGKDFSREEDKVSIEVDNDSLSIDESGSDSSGPENKSSDSSYIPGTAEKDTTK